MRRVSCIRPVIPPSAGRAGEIVHAGVRQLGQGLHLRMLRCSEALGAPEECVDLTRQLMVRVRLPILALLSLESRDARSPQCLVQSCAFTSVMVGRRPVPRARPASSRHSSKHSMTASSPAPARCSWPGWPIPQAMPTAARHNLRLSAIGREDAPKPPVSRRACLPPLRNCGPAGCHVLCSRTQWIEPRWLRCGWFFLLCFAVASRCCLLLC